MSSYFSCIDKSDTLRFNVQSVERYNYQRHYQLQLGSFREAHSGQTTPGQSDTLATQGIFNMEDASLIANEDISPKPPEAIVT